MMGHYPQLQMQLTEDRPRALMKALAEGRLDTALLSLETSLGEVEVEYVGLAVDPFMVALPLDHPLASKQQLQPEDLDSEQVLLLEDEHALSRQVPSLFTRRRGSKVDCRATSIPTLVQMVVRGIGIAILPSLAVSLENHNGHLAVRPLVAPALNRTLALVWRPGHPRSNALREIGHTLRTAWPGSQAAAAANSAWETTQEAALSPPLSAAPPDGRYLL
jgi:LysR family hydrogen peroxide-inducible transcriptional activator